MLLGARAASEKLPPYVVFRGKNIWDSCFAKENEEYAGITYSATKKAEWKRKRFKIISKIFV